MKAEKIIITGGATRIGASIAKSLAGYDVQITLHYNKSVKEVKKLKRELEDYGSKVFIIKADLSIVSQTKRIIPFAYKMMKGLDCLINNASIFEKDDLINFNEKSFNKHMNVNLQAPAILTQNFKRFLKSKKGNTIDESTRPPQDFMSGMLLGPFFMFRKKILQETGKFDEQFYSGNDYDLAMRLVRNGNYHCLNEILGYYLNEGKGLSTKSQSLQPLERTAIELRYNLPILDTSLIKKASESYDIDNLYFDSKKTPLDTIAKHFDQ